METNTNTHTTLRADSQPYDKEAIVGRLNAFGAVAWEGAVYTDEDSLRAALDASEQKHFEPVGEHLVGIPASIGGVAIQVVTVKDLMEQLRGEDDGKQEQIDDLVESLRVANARADAAEAELKTLKTPTNPANPNPATTDEAAVAAATAAKK